MTAEMPATTRRAGRAQRGWPFGERQNARRPCQLTADGRRGLAPVRLCRRSSHANPACAAIRQLLPPDDRQGTERRPRGPNVVLADMSCQQGVDGLHRCPDLLCSRTSSPGEEQEHPAAVLRIWPTFAVAPLNQGFDQAAGGLLRDRQATSRGPERSLHFRRGH